jgi:dihydrofolate synthase/folylpolyglutamate synthase
MPQEPEGTRGREPRLGGALAALYRRVPLGMRPGLDAMRAACARAGHPERAFAAVHVAGTNGKGSTCAMIESIARDAGLRTGLYTSPHLVRFAERIRVDGTALADDELHPVLDEALAHDLSFFETATLAAFLAFRARKVDLAIVEVGIGGRLDATNVLPSPRCCAVSRVALDHQDRLGDTVEAIAREKAAIAKPGSPIVLSRATAPVRAAMVEVAEAAGARVVETSEDVPLPHVALEGEHQRENAMLAWHVARELGIAEASRARGLGNVTWPGRLERIATDAGEYVLDGAHNPDGMTALVRALHRSPPAAIVFGAVGDKAWREMLATLATLDAPRVYVAPPLAPAGRGAASLEDLHALRSGLGASSVEDALCIARDVADRGSVLVCGSLYLVGRARSVLLRLPADPVVAL